MCRKSDNIELMMCSETDEIIEERFESLLQSYWEGLEKSIRGSEFVFDSADLFFYELHNISLNRSGSYIDFPKWLKKKTTINYKNNDGKCFEYSVVVALNYQIVKKNQERISKIKPFVDQSTWK